MLGTLSDQSAKLLAAIKTMNEKKIDLLALSEGMVQPKYSQHPYFTLGHLTATSIAVSPAAVSSGESSGGSVFNPISEHIIHIRLKTLVICFSHRHICIEQTMTVRN